MVGLCSPDPPSEPENLEEDNPGYLIVVTASDEEHSDEGYEGYEPLSDADDETIDNSCDDDVVDLQLTDSPASDCDTQVGGVDHPRCPVNVREFCKNVVSSSDGTLDEAQFSIGSSTGVKTQENSEVVQAGSSSSHLEMGEQQVADVMAAMANITLPPSAVPQWANVVPEDQWIQHIIARVKNLQSKKMNDE